MSQWEQHDLDLAEAAEVFAEWTPAQRARLDAFLAHVKDQLATEWGLDMNGRPELVYAFVAGASVVSQLALDLEGASLFCAYMALEWMPHADRSRITESG